MSDSTPMIIDPATTNSPTSSGSSTTTAPSIAGSDPFDEPLDVISMEEYSLVLEDIFFEQAKGVVNLDGLTFSFLQPPYVNIDNQRKAKLKIRDCYNHKLFLLLYGYSGSGKTTLQKQFQDKYPSNVLRIEDFDDLSPVELLKSIGKLVGVDLKHKASQSQKLREHFLKHPGYMLMFDNVSLKKPTDIDKLESLRKLNEYAHVPILFSGVQKLFDDLYDDSKLSRTCSIVSRMDEFKLTGMTRQDAAMYLEKVGEAESFKVTYAAQQALVTTALNETIGGINAFVTVLGRCITTARAHYYTTGGREIPDKTKCVRASVNGGKAYLGSEVVITLPKTPEPVVLDESLVSKMQSEYKSHFPKVKERR